MNKNNYERLSEITVKSQEELDMIPLDFKGLIYIEFGTHYSKAIVKHNYYYCVVAQKNSSVEAWDNSSVVARENSSVVARENSSVEAWDNSSVEARENSSVVARENSSVEAWENSFVKALGNSSVVALGNSSVVALENSSVVAWENSSVVAQKNSSVEAWDNSFVKALGNSSVVARGNVQVFDYLQNAKIQISGNARIVYNPKTIHEFMDFYGIKHTKTKAVFYKAVRKDSNGVLRSNYIDYFTYEIGKFKTEDCCTDVDRDCSYGIHISHLNWALEFGKDWNNLAILEIETKIADIILPKQSDGKIRTPKIKVLREIPLEECGAFGKILAKKRKRQ